MRKSVFYSEGDIPCGMKFLQEFNFVDRLFCVFCGN